MNILTPPPTPLGLDDGDHGGDEDGTVMTVGGERFAAPPPAMEAVHLKEHLTSGSEYSYFSDKLITSWAGPGHWRVKVGGRDERHISAMAAKASLS